MARKTAKVRSVGGSEPELIALAKPAAALRVENKSLRSQAGVPTAKAEKKLSKYEAIMKPLFGPSEERVESMVREQESLASASLMPLSGFYRIEAPEKNLEKIQKDMLEEDLFDGVYIKPPVEAPEEINTMIAVADAPPSSTADFSARQIYLNAAPDGVDARWAWTQAGGRGDDVRIVDLEGNWRFTHEDLMQKQGGVIGGSVIDDLGWRNHGTAVIGEYGGDINGFGIQGICSDAITSALSFSGLGTGGAINLAASRLRAGDILLLELHRPGPRHNFQGRQDQRGYIAIEWWPDDFVAILNASRQGIIVVEAAGNGAEDLDDAIYETPGFGFPSDWINSFGVAIATQGPLSSVLVHRRPEPTDAIMDRIDHALASSNYGTLIDAQGWGREVTTCGYGDLQGGQNEDLWYTDTFSGTSSASPIIVGTVGCIQGMARARGRAVFTPAEIRDAFRTTGSPQQAAPGRPLSQRIGNRPDIRALAQTLFPVGGNKRPAAFRREIESWRPLEVRAFVDITPQLVSEHTTGVLQAGLVSAQSVRNGAANLEDLVILFRLSAIAGQAVEIAGPVGGGRYRYWGSIAADGLGQLFVDEGFSTTGSDNFDLIAEIQSVETRFAFDQTLQRYQQV